MACEQLACSHSFQPFRWSAAALPELQIALIDNTMHTSAAVCHRLSAVLDEAAYDYDGVLSEMTRPALYGPAGLAAELSWLATQGW